jgi:hypothetical protein
MHPTTGVAWSPSRPERRYRRFKLECPVHLLFRSGELVSEADAVSRNVSIAGLLVNCTMLIPQNSAVTFILNLRSQTLRPVQLMGEGRVVRVERGKTEAEFAIALECKDPISEIESYFPANSS